MNRIGHHGNVVQFLFDGLLAGIVGREREGGGEEREKLMFFNVYLVYVVERPKGTCLV